MILQVPKEFKNTNLLTSFFKDVKVHVSQDPSEVIIQKGHNRFCYIRYLNHFCGASHLHGFTAYDFDLSIEEFFYVLDIAASNVPYFDANRRIFLTCHEGQRKDCKFLKYLEPFVETESKIHNRNSGNNCWLMTFILPEITVEYV